MQEWSDDNDILMYSNYNEGKLVIAERFVRTLKAKTDEKRTANKRRSYLAYLNKLEDRSIQ